MPGEAAMRIGEVAPRAGVRDWLDAARRCECEAIDDCAPFDGAAAPPSGAGALAGLVRRA